MNMLGILEDDHKKDWEKHISTMVHAYNATRHATTGQSPFYLMFGRQQGYLSTYFLKTLAILKIMVTTISRLKILDRD